jgi:ABC-type transporter Mla subunit MlaD
MTRVGVDFEAINAGAGQIGQARDRFGQFSSQVGATPGAVAPDPIATALLDRVLESIAGALHTAAAQLDDLGGGLAATASGYEQVEQVLSNWNVPSGTTL